MTGYESKRAAAQDKLAQPAQEPVAVYGYCPECGAKGVMRERRPNGNDKCANGHTYPSNTSTPPQPAQEPVACAECERLRSALKRANGLAEHFERAWYLRGDEIEQLNAQPEQEPVCPACKAEVLYECVACSNNNYPPQPAQEPVAWRYRGNLHEFDPSDWATGPVTPLYTTPPQRPWVELTDEKIALIDWESLVTKKDCVRAIEAKLKEENT